MYTVGIGPFFCLQFGCRHYDRGNSNVPGKRGTHMYIGTSLPVVSMNH
jgi:hypothetical protein